MRGRVCTCGHPRSAHQDNEHGSRCGFETCSCFEFRDKDAPDERNPDHPVTTRARDHWHTIAALILFKSGASKMVITSEDIERLQTDGRANIVAHDKADGLHIYLVDEATAANLAKKFATKGGPGEPP